MSIVYVGSDHRGWQLKTQIVESLRENGTEVTELGKSDYDSDDDYADIAFELGEKVVSNKGLGILICSSGVGVSVAANKVQGVRAGLCMNEKQAVLARNDDDINILCLSADMLDEEENMAIVRSFLNTTFSSDERFIRRIKKIKKYEMLK